MDEQLHALTDLYEKAVTALPIEHAVFNRLLYKFRNAHRRTIYYRKLVHVRKYLRLINISDVIPILKTHAADGNQSIRDDERLVDRLRQTGRQLDEAIAVILDCSWHLFHLLKQTFFMSMALVFVAILSRVFVIFKTLLQSLAKVSIVLGSGPRWQEPADDKLRIGADLLSGRLPMKALPNSPVHPESDSGESRNETNAPEDVTEIVFSDDLLDTIAALEEGCDSAEDTIDIQSAADEPVDRRASEDSAQTIALAALASPSEKSEEKAEERSSERKPRKKAALRRPKKRSRDDVDDIFGDLE